MSAFRFYLSVPTAQGEYSDFQEITEYVLESSVGRLTQKLSSNEYDIGTIKFNKITIHLDNKSALFSEVGNVLSMFTYKRDETILRITWDSNNQPIYCGSTPCGHAFLDAPVEVYKGLLEDNSSKFDAELQIQKFNFLGLASVIGKTQVPFSSLSVSDDIETTVYNILNQDRITKFMTVDQSNISVNLNFTPDVIAPLENKTCLAALDELLFLSGAVLYVKDDTVYVTPRVESNDSKYTFYGPSSDLGIENLHDVSDKTTGINRTFNLFKWRDTNLVQSFVDSIDKHGERQKEIQSDLVTNNSTRTQILNALLTEFGFPKQELTITVPIYTPILTDVFLLDKINIDYPADYRGNPDNSLPSTYGPSVYGEARYIISTSSLIISVATDWMILNRTIDVKNQKINYRIREV